MRKKISPRSESGLAKLLYDCTGQNKYREIWNLTVHATIPLTNPFYQILNNKAKANCKSLSTAKFA